MTSLVQIPQYEGGLMFVYRLPLSHKHHLSVEAAPIDNQHRIERHIFDQDYTFADTLEEVFLYERYFWQERYSNTQYLPALV